MMPPLSEKPKVSVVAPVYNEIENIYEFVQRITSTLENEIHDWELIFSADPSTDGTERAIKDLIKTDSRIKLVELSRRFGQPGATLAGLYASSGDAVIVIDADLQDPPELVSKMISEWQQGFEVVIPVRSSRKGEPLTKRLTAAMGYWFLKRFSSIEIPSSAGDFRLMSRRVVDHVTSLPEAGAFLRGMVATVGFRTQYLSFERPERIAGSTKHNKWFGSIKIGLNGVIGYSSALLSISVVLGVVSGLASILIALAYALAKIIGIDFPLGNPTIVVSVLLMGGLNLLGIGVLGFYLDRVFEEVKGRPRFVVREALGLDKIPIDRKHHSY